MRAVFVLACLARPAAADVDPPSKWVAFADKKLAIKLRRPANAKVDVQGSAIRVTGPELPEIAIAIAATTDRTTTKEGGAHQLHVEWTIAVPKRVARCTADAADTTQAAHASAICDTIELEPAPRAPHVELHVTSSGLADAAAFERAVQSKQKQLDRCWKDALAKDPEFGEGAASLHRSYDKGQLATSDEKLANFAARDTKPLGKCLFDVAKSVPVKAADAAAQLAVDMICLLY
jgi:hypothetical protein